MEGYVPSASLYRPTFSTYMRANPFSKIKTVYYVDHQRRLEELGDRPYFRQIYPELPPHYPGTWCVYSRQDIEAVVDRLYTIPSRWEIPRRKQPAGHDINAANSPNVFPKHSRGRLGLRSADYQHKYQVSSKSKDISARPNTAPNPRPEPRQRNHFTVLQNCSSSTSDTNVMTRSANIYDDNMSVTSKTYSLLQTISSTDGKLAPVFFKRNRQKQIKKSGRKSAVRAQPKPSNESEEKQEKYVKISKDKIFELKNSSTQKDVSVSNKKMSDDDILQALDETYETDFLISKII